jgi:hypothetical protein
LQLALRVSILVRQQSSKVVRWCITHPLSWSFHLKLRALLSLSGLVLIFAAPGAIRAQQPIPYSGAVFSYAWTAWEAEPSLAQARALLTQEENGRRRGRGALWGAGIGLVAGGLLAGLSVETEDDTGLGGGLTEASATGEAVVLGAVVGAGIGALLGATIFAPSGSERGESRVSVTPIALTRGVALRVDIR